MMYEGVGVVKSGVSLLSHLVISFWLVRLLSSGIAFDKVLVCTKDWVSFIGSYILFRSYAFWYTFCITSIFLLNINKIYLLYLKKCKV